MYDVSDMCMTSFSYSLRMPAYSCTYVRVYVTAKESLNNIIALEASEVFPLLWERKTLSRCI